jgi:hypothetical protein
VDGRAFVQLTVAGATPGAVAVFILAITNSQGATVFKRVLRGASVGSALLVLILPAVANAAPGSRTFAQTFPVASHLCNRATLPKSLQGQQAKVAADCAALQSAYNSAVTAGQTAEANFAAAVQAARGAAQAACNPKPLTPAGHAACKQARNQARHEVALQRAGLKLALKQFHLSLQQARLTFWTAIHDLRGGAGLPTDPPVSPTTPIPS